MHGPVAEAPKGGGGPEAAVREMVVGNVCRLGACGLYGRWVVCRDGRRSLPRAMTRHTLMHLHIGGSVVSRCRSRTEDGPKQGRKLATQF